jgi:hypothetical protein
VLIISSFLNNVKRSMVSSVWPSYIESHYFVQIDFLENDAESGRLTVPRTSGKKKDV